MKKIIIAFLLMLPIIALSKPLTDSQISALKEAVGKDLKDEESARYKLGDFIPQKKISENSTDETGVYCGLVNSKNSFNAYVGYRAFYVIFMTSPKTNKLAAIRIGTPGSNDDASIRIMCKDEGYDL